MSREYTAGDSAYAWRSVQKVDEKMAELEKDKPPKPKQSDISPQEDFEERAKLIPSWELNNDRACDALSRINKDRG